MGGKSSNSMHSYSMCNRQIAGGTHLKHFLVSFPVVPFVE